MTTMQTRGFGSSRKPKQVAPVDRYCISPQLAPPMISPVSKKLFDETESYHAGRGGKADRK